MARNPRGRVESHAQSTEQSLSLKHQFFLPSEDPPECDVVFLVVIVDLTAKVSFTKTDASSDPKIGL